MNVQKKLLKNIKRVMREEFDKKVFVIQEKIKELRQKANPNKNLITQLINEEDALFKEFNARCGKKMKNRIQKIAERENIVTKKINYDALIEHRANTRAQNKQQVGASWLHEGALVTLRNQTELMIVTCIGSNNTEVLVGGGTKKFRTKSLRPADWLNDDE